MGPHLSDIRAIVLDILGPILALVLLGALMRRKLAVDVGTLSRLTMYLFTPAFMFDQVVNSTLSSAEMGGVMLITLIQILTLGIAVWIFGRMFHVRRETLAAIALTVMFYNSGNYGLPLAKLAFPGKEQVVGGQQTDGGTVRRGDGENKTDGGTVRRGDGKNKKDGETVGRGDGERIPSSSFPPSPRPTVPPSPSLALPPTKDGGAVQTFVALTQNLLTFTVGLWITSMASGRRGLHGLWHIVRLPFLPTIAAALLARWWLRSDGGHHLPVLIAQTAHYLSDGLIPVALVTLGAQLAASPRWPRWRPVSVVLLLRLIFGPVQMIGMLYVFHLIGWRATDLWPWPAQLIILTAGTPTAINALILTLEIGGDAELTADCVFWTTVLSSVTITGWLMVVR